MKLRFNWGDALFLIIIILLVYWITSCNPLQDWKPVSPIAEPTPSKVETPAKLPDWLWLFN